MPRPRHTASTMPLNRALSPIKTRKPAPFEFVLDALSSLEPTTRPMFGCVAIYIRNKIVLILRDKPTYSADNGVWLATTAEHHLTLRLEFPNMRSIGLLRKKITGWQILPASAPDFEESALRACELVLAADPRIGKIPTPRRNSKTQLGKLERTTSRKKPRATSAKNPAP